MTYRREEISRKLFGLLSQRQISVLIRRSLRLYDGVSVDSEYPSFGHLLCHRPHIRYDALVRRRSVFAHRRCGYFNFLLILSQICPRYVPDIDWICPNLPLYTSTSKSDYNPITSFHFPSTPFFVWMSISYAGTPAPEQSITHMDLTSPSVDPCPYPKLSLPSVSHLFPSTVIDISDDTPVCPPVPPMKEKSKFEI